jgi:hypothetical protein
MKTNTLDRQSMIKALISYELDLLLGNRIALEDVASFFAEGGYHNYTDMQLLDSCRENVWLEVNHE